MARNYFTNVSAATVLGAVLARPLGVGYDANDDIQSVQHPTSNLDQCVFCGDRSRRSDFDTDRGFAAAWTAFLATAAAANSFTLEGIKCSDGLVESQAYSLGNGLGDSFEFSADGRTAATATIQVLHIGDPTIHA